MDAKSVQRASVLVAIKFEVVAAKVPFARHIFHISYQSTVNSLKSVIILYKTCLLKEQTSNSISKQKFLPYL